MIQFQPNILVLRGKAHGVPSTQCVGYLKQKLPEYTINFAKTHRQETDLIGDANIAVGLEIDEELISEAKNLRLFACGSAGVDHLPMDALSEADISVTNASGIHEPQIAEHVIVGMLYFVRKLHTANRLQRTRQWRHYGTSRSLSGSTVTIVGLGAIGHSVAEKLSGFDIRTIGIRYSPNKGGPTDEVFGYHSPRFHEVLSETDFLCVTCGLSKTTRQLIDSEVFRTLPPHSILINVARGEVVDSDSLYKALTTSGTMKIQAAFIDVTDPEPLPPKNSLWGLDNVLITPHVGGNSPTYWEDLSEILLKNIRIIEKTGKYSGLVNQVLP